MLESLTRGQAIGSIKGNERAWGTNLGKRIVDVSLNVVYVGTIGICCLVGKCFEFEWENGATFEVLEAKNFVHSDVDDVLSATLASVDAMSDCYKKVRESSELRRSTPRPSQTVFDHIRG